MLYRALDKNGDYQLNQFLKDTPDTVGQAVQTRLKLYLAEWFMDTSDGTPWYERILGHNTEYDLEIRDRILGTEGVTEIVQYNSSLDTERSLSVQTTINTIYGTTTVTIQG